MKDIRGIIREVLEEVISDDVVIGVSNRHIHLSQKDLDTLFGEGYKLSKMKDMKQPGQFATNEKLDIVGPKGKFSGVRIIGPVRKETQVEISITDSFKLGLTPPIRQSGDLEIVKVETYGERKIIMCNVVLRVSDKMAKEMHIDVDEANAAGLKNDDYVKIIRE